MNYYFLFRAKPSISSLLPYMCANLYVTLHADSVVKWYVTILKHGSLHLSMYLLESVLGHHALLRLILVDTQVQVSNQKYDWNCGNQQPGVKRSLTVCLLFVNVICIPKAGNIINVFAEVYFHVLEWGRQFITVNGVYAKMVYHYFDS